jgi:ribonuclease P protein component
MLKPENRLKKTRDFNLVIKHGRWVNAEFFDLKYLELAKNREFFPKKEDPEDFVKQLKLAFSVGLKLSKSAVKRNRLRRQMREAARLLIKDERLKNGYFILFVAKKGSMDLDYAKISQEISLLLKKGGIKI